MSLLRANVGCDFREIFLTYFFFIYMKVYEIPFYLEVHKIFPEIEKESGSKMFENHRSTEM